MPGPATTVTDGGRRTALDIARSAKLAPIASVAEEMGIGEDLLQPYGTYVAKIRLEAIEALADRPKARYVVVTAVTPTPLGEGKTTTTLGLAQGMHHVGRRATAAIRQASMGPTFGIKGGAAGGGYSQAAPFEALNLHLTGDMHAVTAAHNTLAAMVDNHLYQGNELDLDPAAITWRRALDVNDRALRNIVLGLGSREDGVPRQSGFDITAASEVMAILALSTSLQDMRRRLGEIIVGFTADGTPVTAEQLRAAGAMAVIMRDAIQPNLLQSLENTPVLVHAGPFGNIAHGNSSVIADLIGIHAGDYLITEAGFGADMGAERFFNIKCRVSGLIPDAAVIVTTVRALKAHSGAHRIVAGRPLPEALLARGPRRGRTGGANLRKQIENVLLHGVTPVVAINAFPEDSESEYAAIARDRRLHGRPLRGDHPLPRRRGRRHRVGPRPWWPQPRSPAASISSIRPSGHCGTRSRPSPPRCTEPTASTISRRRPGASTSSRPMDLGGFPLCIAKTHLSISSNPALKGAPTGWRLPVREVRASAGAGFIYAICGDMRTMPGLSRHPAAEHIDIDENGDVVGLY